MMRCALELKQSAMGPWVHPDQETLSPPVHVSGLPLLNETKLNCQDMVTRLLQAGLNVCVPAPNANENASAPEPVPACQGRMRPHYHYHHFFDEDEPHRP
jgi:hypothetical protein